MTEQDIAGLAVVVTGGSSGIGHAICLDLAAAGARVAVVGRRAEPCDAVVAEIRAAGGDALAVPADVSDGEQVAAMMQRVVDAFGTVDVLVNNAGFVRGREIHETTPEDFKAVMDTNVCGTFNCTHAAWLIMRERGRGQIVNMASQAAGWPGCEETAYGTSKTAQVKLTLHTLDQFRKANGDEPTFFACAVCPGGVDTPWYDGRNVNRERMLRDTDVSDLVRKIVECPTKQRSDFEQEYAEHPTVLIGPVGIFEPHPLIIRIWFGQL